MNLSHFNFLTQHWPAVFSTPPKPLGLGMHAELTRALCRLGQDEDQAASQAKKLLAGWCQRESYLQRLQPGAKRINLSGQPAGEVTELEAANALQKRANLPALREDRAARAQARAQAHAEKLAREAVIGAANKAKRQAAHQAFLAETKAKLKAAKQAAKQAAAAHVAKPAAAPKPPPLVIVKKRRHIVKPP